MPNIWVTTDWHAIEIDERTGRKSISNSFLKLTRKAEKLVRQNDIILCLGDIAFRGQDDIVNGKADEELSPFGDMIRNMPGYKILVKGNHDGLGNQEYLKVGFQEVGTAATLGDFLFTHKPYPVSNDQVNVHGHTHHEHYIGLDDGKHIAIPPTEKSNDPPLLLLDDVLEQAKQKRMKEPMRTVQHLKDADREFCHKLATDSDYLKEVISLEDSYEAVMTNGLQESISPARIPGLGHHYIHPNAVQASMMLATMMDDGMDPTRDSDILETLNPDEVDISKTIDESISITPYDIMMGQVMKESLDTIITVEDNLYYISPRSDGLDLMGQNWFPSITNALDYLIDRSKNKHPMNPIHFPGDFYLYKTTRDHDVKQAPDYMGAVYYSREVKADLIATVHMDETGKDSIVPIDEANIVIGKDISIRFENLPKKIQYGYFQICREKYGWDEKRARGEYDRKVISSALANPASGVDGFSVLGNERVLSAIQHSIEQYDSNRDQAILASENIVEAYNAVNRMDVEKAIGLIQSIPTDENEQMEYIKENKLAVILNSLKALQTQFAILVSIIEDRKVDDIIVNRYVEELGITQDTIVNIITNSVYTPTNNPDEVRAVLNARASYNRTITSILQTALEMNYQFLGLSKDEAQIMINQIGKSDNDRNKVMSIIRERLRDPEVIQKTKRSYGFDLSEFNGGKIIYAPEAIDLQKFGNLEYMFQSAMEYDMVVISHGNISAKEITDNQQRIKEQAQKTIKNKLDAIGDIKRQIDSEYNRAGSNMSPEEQRIMGSIVNEIKEYEHLTNRIGNRVMEYESYLYTLHALGGDSALQSSDYLALKSQHDEDAENIESYNQKILDILDEIRYVDSKYTETAERIKAFHRYRMELEKQVVKINSYVNRSGGDTIKLFRHKRYRKHLRWVCMPVTTPGGVTCTDVNTLLRQLIKEGYKKIKLFSCNPGHYELDRDIKNTPGVTINMGTNVVILESADEYAKIDSILESAEHQLITFCDQNQIDYNDTSYLNECTTFIISNASEVINEGMITNAWESIKTFIKKFIGFIVSLFRKMINFIRTIINKIKSFFSNARSDFKNISDPVEVHYMMIENAQFVNKQNKSWDMIEREVLLSCNRISNKIKELEQSNLRNAKMLEQYADQKSKSIDEATLSPMGLRKEDPKKKKKKLSKPDDPPEHTPGDDWDLVDKDHMVLPPDIQILEPRVSENASVNIVSLHGGLADDFHEVRSDYEPPERKALRLHKKALEYKLANLDEGAVDYLLREIRAYKIRFDRHGNVRITKRETNHLKEHFNNSVSLLRAYRNADDVASVKQECMKLRYMSEILLKYYIRPNNHSDEMKELINLRSTILNALNTNLKWVKQKDPKYNFAEEYDRSKYGSDINLPRNVVRDATKTIVTLLV